MTNKINELQEDIGINLDAMIPTEYEKAWVIYELGPGVAPSFWFCYIDASTGNVIPADGLEERKDIIINDMLLYENSMNNIIHDVQKLQKEYISAFDKCWYAITYQLNSNGTFNISFSYEKPIGSLQERREKWCMEHLGIMPPRITVDMLRS
ncbi:MAG: DUF600 family protein [Oscillospiraceae bacterium]|nr:DUF600 family protein [Oscillospiraceae bacterium]